MTWKELFEQEKNKEYFQKLTVFLKEESHTKIILPEINNVYKAFQITKIEDIKIVIIGQDPYPNKLDAMGLAFSVNQDRRIPKSLDNMFKEYVSDLGFNYPKNGDLTKWAKNGIFLLNRILTVEEGKPLSHKDKGWEKFTLEVIKEVEKQDQKIVYILLGQEAQTLKKFITNDLHISICAPHPSPLSVYRGFFGSKIYSKSCQYLGISSKIWEL